jgi:DNA-binding GntR family transcriptional regulator
MAAPHETAREDVVPHADVPNIARVAEERTVEQIVAGELRRSILDGRLGPGERLRYRQLAAQLGVSVTPVRVALKELSSEGLVELRPHAGARVSELGLEELEEVVLTRASLEPWLAMKGAVRLSDDDVSSMRRHLDDVRSATEALDRDGYLRTSWELRAVVYRAAERPRLLARVSTLYDFSLRYHHLNLADRERLARSLGYMEAFSDACAARDGPRAQGVMREAIEWTLEYLVEALEPGSAA